MLTNVGNNCDVYISLTNIGERLIYVFLRRMSVKKRRKSINLSLELNLIERERERKVSFNDIERGIVNIERRKSRKCN